MLNASPFINQSTFTVANNACPNRCAHYDLYLEYNLFQQIQTHVQWPVYSAAVTIVLMTTSGSVIMYETSLRSKKYYTVQFLPWCIFVFKNLRLLLRKLHTDLLPPLRSFRNQHVAHLHRCYQAQNETSWSEILMAANTNNVTRWDMAQYSFIDWYSTFRRHLSPTYSNLEPHHITFQVLTFISHAFFLRSVLWTTHLLLTNSHRCATQIHLLATVRNR
jgi:hypothetical protein